MARLIKKAEVKVVVKKLSEMYEIGETVSWSIRVHDGRSYYSREWVGDIIKINRLTVDVKLSNGYIYRVHRDELE